jgi:hypothetical protein
VWYVLAVALSKSANNQGRPSDSSADRGLFAVRLVVCLVVLAVDAWIILVVSSNYIAFTKESAYHGWTDKAASVAMIRNAQIIAWGVAAAVIIGAGLWLRGTHRGLWILLAPLGVVALFLLWTFIRLQLS